MEPKKTFGTDNTKKYQDAKKASEEHIQEIQRKHRPIKDQQKYIRELKEKTLGGFIQDFNNAVGKYEKAFSGNDDYDLLNTLDTLDKSLQPLKNFHAESSEKHYADLYGQNQYNEHQTSTQRAKEKTLQKLNENFDAAVAVWRENDRPAFRGSNYGLINAIDKLQTQGGLLEEFYQKYSDFDTRSKKIKEAHKVLYKDGFSAFKKYTEENPNWKS